MVFISPEARDGEDVAGVGNCDAGELDRETGWDVFADGKFVVSIDERSPGIVFIAGLEHESPFKDLVDINHVLTAVY